MSADVDPVASVNGHRTQSCVIHVPNVGPWFADVDLIEAVALAGRVTLQVGALGLTGTVAPSSSGTFGESTRLRIVAGGGGWGKLLPAKAYHNDVQIKAATVAGDAAREAGETLGSFAPTRERVGVDYVRRAGPASQVLDDALEGAAWWVDYQGVTHGGARPPSPAAADGYELLEYNPRSQLAVLALDDLATVGIGSVLTARLDAPQTVRELEVVITGAKMRVSAWCGGDPGSRARLPQLLAAIVERIVGGKLWGKYRYRLVSMAFDGRVNLQAVSKAVGLPDLLPISMKPGVAGAHAELTPGAEVYVEFVAGEPTDPIVTGFAGKGDGGFVPERLMFGTESASAAQDAARKGDTVKVLLPPAVFSGTISGGPATGILTFPSMYALGTIETGSSKVGIA